MSSKKNLQIREKKLTDFPKSFSAAIIGKPGSGKSNLVKEFIRYNAHIYPAGRAFCSSEDEYLELCSVFGPLFVSNHYDEEQFKFWMIRQRNLTMQKNCENPGCILALDDVSNKGTSVWKSPIIAAAVKLGSRRYESAMLLCSHRCIEMHTDTRNNISFAILFYVPDGDERKKLYRNLGGAAGSYEVFSKLMEELCKDYTAMVIDNLTPSTKLEDRIFWIKAPYSKKSLTFGCKEYKKWNDDRYNPDYVETIEI